MRLAIGLAISDVLIAASLVPPPGFLQRPIRSV
jgi:hypothetical protein